MSWLLRILRDDKVALALLFVPFLIGAFAIFWSGALHRPERLIAQSAPTAEAHAAIATPSANLRYGDLQPEPTEVEPANIALLDPAALADSQPDQPDDLVTAIDRELYELNGKDRYCSLDEAAAAHALILERVQSYSPQQTLAFGRALADAAEAQTRDFVVYTGKYRQISFPMGDVSSMFGVCTDVIIRAYRTVGVDLQARVQKAHVGSGDTSIDHRRTETLRRFFAKYGTSLPITDFADDYLPGDIVTYDRPQNQHTRSHIAIVSNRIARSGRPMIVHNRGWGPQIEDAVFVDRITGHYRYRGEIREAKADAELPSGDPDTLLKGSAETGTPAAAASRAAAKTNSAKPSQSEGKSSVPRRLKRFSHTRRTTNSEPKQ